MNDMKRSTDVLITEVELMNSSAERVYEWYVKRCDIDGKIEINDILDRTLEVNLLDRNERLINLAIAKYGVYPDTVRKIFNKALEDNDEVMTLACFSNTVLGRIKYSISSIPDSLVENLFQKYEWFSSLNKRQITTLFENPTIEQDFLADFLSGNEYWNAIDDEKRLDVVYALANNESLLKSSRTYYSYIHILQSFWKLAESVPITAEWAQALADLYDKLPKKLLGFDNEKSIKRWMIDFPNDDKLDEKYWPNPYEQIRIALYGLSTTDNIKTKEFNKIYFNHSDIAQRISAYKKLRITVDEMDEAFEKDKLLSIGAFLENFYIWRNKDTRNALKEIVSNPEVSKNDFIFERYDYLQELYEKDYPEWFEEKDEEEIIDTIDKPITYRLARDLLAEGVYPMLIEISNEATRIEKEFKKRIEILLVITGCILFVIFWKLL
jgi:hypothetical protein